MTNVTIIDIMMRRFAAATHVPFAGAGIDLTLIRAPGSDHWEATSTPGWTYNKNNILPTEGMEWGPEVMFLGWFSDLKNLQISPYISMKWIPVKIKQLILPGAPQAGAP